MNFLESIKVALRSLKSNKLRSILTMLGIIIGVGAVIAMVSIGQGAQQSITNSIQGLGSNLLIVTSGQNRNGPVAGESGSLNNLTIDDMKAITQKVTTINSAAPESSTNATVVYGSQNTQTSISGSLPEYQAVRNIHTQVGRFFNKDEVASKAKVAVLGQTVVQDLFGDANANVVGKTIKIKNMLFTVVGVLESKGSSGFMNQDDRIIIPITTIQSRMLGDDSIRTIYIDVKSADLMDTAQQQITNVLRKRHNLKLEDADDFRIQNQAEILSSAQSITQTFTLLLAGVAAISLLVGGIGIMNIMLVSVTERTREIGIRKAIGAKGRDILVQFLIEAIVLSLLGGIIGIILGVGGSSMIAKVAGWSTSVTISSILLSFGFSAAIGIIFGVFPAQKAAGLRPIDALRYE